MNIGRALLLLGLSALIASCSSSGGRQRALLEWSDQTADVAQDVIDDPDRAAEAARIADDFQAEVVGLYDVMTGAEGEWSRLNVDYDATREQFEDVVTRLRMDRVQRYERLIALALQMRATMTDEEWTKFSARTRPIEPDQD